MMRFVLAALLLLTPLTAFAATYSGVSLEGASDEVVAASSDYVTLVVFGDTQALMADCAVSSATDRCPEFDASLDWIQTNKTTENIAGVFFVGDLIDAGTPLPPSIDGGTATECDDQTVGSWTVPLASEATCRAHDGNQTNCEAETGCFWYNGTASSANDCLTCARVDLADDQWDAFVARTDRLEPTGNIDIPFFLTKGNHDNAGEEHLTDPAREPEGYNTRYEDTYWQGLESGYGGVSVFEHVSVNSDVDGDGQAWTFDMDGTEVLVVSPPYVSNVGVESGQITWALDVLTDYPTTPAILLVHSLGQTDATIQGISETVAPNLFAAFGGHTGSNSAVVDTNGNELLINTVTDWTSASVGGENDYITLVRWYPSTQEIEVYDYSVNGDVSDATSGNVVSKQSFDIMPAILATDAPYDLSEHTARIDSVFADTYPPRWPIEPTITSTSTATTCADLVTGIVNGEHVTIETGVTIGSSGSPCSSVVITESDVWLELEGTATVWLTSFNLSGDRIKITGGTLNSSTTNFCNADDLLIQNVNFGTSSDATVENENGCSRTVSTVRNAYVSNTIYGDRYGLFQGQPGTTVTDLIIVNNDITCSPYTTSDGEVCIRVQWGDRVWISDNRIESVHNAKETIRFYAANDNAAVVDNVLVKNTGTNTTAESHSGTHLGAQNNIWFTDNRYMSETSNTTTEVSFGTHDSGTYPCDNMNAIDNEVWTPNNDTFNQATYINACSNVTVSGNTNGDIDDVTPYNGSIPTCATLGCGADN